MPVCNVRSARVSSFSSALQELSALFEVVSLASFMLMVIDIPLQRPCAVPRSHQGPGYPG